MKSENASATSVGAGNKIAPFCLYPRCLVPLFLCSSSSLPACFLPFRRLQASPRSSFYLPFTPNSPLTLGHEPLFSSDQTGGQVRLYRPAHPAGLSVHFLTRLGVAHHPAVEQDRIMDRYHQIKSESDSRLTSLGRGRRLLCHASLGTISRPGSKEESLRSLHDQHRTRLGPNPHGRTGIRSRLLHHPGIRR